VKWNALGFLVFVAAFGAAYGILCAIAGTVAEGPWMMIAGPLIAIADVAYRTRAGIRLLGDIQRGPSILLLPAWVWGGFWFALGGYYHARS